MARWLIGWLPTSQPANEMRPIRCCAWMWGPLSLPQPEATWCSSGLFGAATVIPGAVFAGARDGTLRAYSTADGEVLWEYNTMQEYETVNGVRAKGGSIGGHGPAIAGGMLFTGSGYATSSSPAPGNVLLAFGVE